MAYGHNFLDMAFDVSRVLAKGLAGCCFAPFPSFAGFETCADRQKLLPVLAADSLFAIC